MRILLIAPRDPLSLIGFSGIDDDSDVKPLMPNLALLTLAAMVGDDDEVVVVDEQLEAIDFDEPWDVVGITGYSNHRDRMREIASELRARGRLVVMGGPFVSMAPHELRDYADVLVLGEAERTWPQFLADLRDGSWQPEYREQGSIDLAESPLPAFEHAGSGYLVGVVQASRGCPFQCDFCDVIIYLGRRQRHKPATRVVEELQRLYELGYREVFIADDNFTASRAHAKELLTEIVAWNATKQDRLTWLTQLSIDAARDPELLDLCAQAGLIQAFIGIETINQDALRDARKRQNLHRDIAADLRELYRRGIGVQAGMIVGFDADTLHSFRAQYDFLQTAAVPTITLNLLNAPYGTPLYQRMLRDGRLVPPEQRHYRDFEVGIQPLNMSADELAYGARWLVNKLYAPDNFATRLQDFAALLPDETNTGMDPHTSKRGLELWSGLMRSYRRLGPEFRKILFASMKTFRRKNKALLPTILLQYKHVVATLQRRGVWDPALAELDDPDFTALRRAV